jgi:hypothetical protein
MFLPQMVPLQNVLLGFYTINLPNSRHLLLKNKAKRKSITEGKLIEIADTYMYLFYVHSIEQVVFTANH